MSTSCFSTTLRRLSTAASRFKNPRNPATFHLLVGWQAHAAVCFVQESLAKEAKCIHSHPNMTAQARAQTRTMRLPGSDDHNNDSTDGKRTLQWSTSSAWYYQRLVSASALVFAERVFS